MEDELKQVIDSKAKIESQKFKSSDFWKAYESVLNEKLVEKTNDTINLLGEKLYRAQGAAQAIMWIIASAPDRALEKMRKPSQQ